MIKRPFFGNGVITPCGVIISHVFSSSRGTRSVANSYPSLMAFVLCSLFISVGLRTRKALEASAGCERSRTEDGRGCPRDSYIAVQKSWKESDTHIYEERIFGSRCCV